MAIFKCKMCGGTLEVSEGMTVCECEYCGTKQTLPKTDNEQTINMLNRASHFRQQCEFDKAMEIYEKLLDSSDKDSEIYWQIVLCRYGIEYVDDPLTKKKIPTCHRTQFNSILNDADYLEALNHADSIQKDVYIKEAEYIDNVQKGIFEVSNKEEPFDVFICYKETDENGKRTHDSVLAQDLYYQLEREGFKVFFSRITLEGKLGTAYEPYIFAALNSAQVMVVVGTKQEYFNAVWVKNEWSRYLMLMQNDRSKTIIPAYKDMDAYDLPDALSMFQAQDMSKLGFMQDLIHGIRKIAKNEPAPQVLQQTTPSSTNECILENGLYTGGMFAGKPNGNGKAVYKNGDIYEGEWYVGVKHGMGKLTCSNGNMFEGEYRDDKPCNGKAKYIYDNGSYIGEIKEGEITGQGEFHYGYGDVYIGEWLNGEWHGQGKLTYADGASFEGIFHNGEAYTGKGKLVYDNGFYIGVIKEGKWHG